MDKLLKSDKNQRILSLTICALLSYMPILLFVKSVLRFFVPPSFNYDTYAIMLILFILFIKSLFVISNNIKIDILYVLAFIIICFSITYLVFSENRIFMFTSFFDVVYNPLYILLVYSFSGYIFIRYIYDYELFIMYMSYISIIVVLVSIITYFIQLQFYNGVDLDYMTFSYNMTIHTMLLINNFLYKKKKLFGIFGLIGLIIILFTGARGAIVSVLATLLIYLMCRRTSIVRKYNFMLILVIALLILALFYKDIIKLLIFISEQFGINSRTLHTILEGSFLDSSGRFDIQKDIINNYTLWGLGLYGDRRVSYLSTYAHNFFVEIFAHFGFILGPFIILLIIYIILRGLLSKNDNLCLLTASFLSAGFMKLMFSGSYLNQEPAFFILLGLGVNALYDRRRGKNEDFSTMQYNDSSNS